MQSTGRQYLAMPILVLLFAFAGPLHAQTPSAFEQQMFSLEQSSGGRLGVALLDASGKLIAAYRGDKRFAMCSTFKLPLAAAVMREIEAGELDFETILRFDESDKVAYAPVTGPRLPNGEITVLEAIEAIVQISDNIAANLLLKAQGGPEEFNQFMRSLGDKVTRLDRYEPALNENQPGDPRDTTSPKAMARSLHTILTGDALRESNRRVLNEITRNVKTGKRRIPAGIPEGWEVAHKTGTCGTAYNDIGYVIPADGDAGFMLTIYLDRPTVSSKDAEAVIAEVTRAAIQATRD